MRGAGLDVLKQRNEQHTYSPCRVTTEAQMRFTFVFHIFDLLSCFIYFTYIRVSYILLTAIVRATFRPLRSPSGTSLRRGMRNEGESCVVLVVAVTVRRK